MANPFPLYLRVPFMWYRSNVAPQHAFETETTIRRRYDHTFGHSELEGHRYFCGHCGTPIAYHSEETGDADFIMVTLGSLDTEDLRDLEIMGLIPSSDDGEDDENRVAPPKPSTSANDSEEISATDPAIDNALKILAGIPWFESLVEGSILGRLTQATRARQTEIAVPGGDDTPKLTIQWEITEFHDDDDDESDDAGLHTRSETLFGKRKLREFVDEMEKELGF